MTENELPNRRQFLAAATTGGMALLAGCGGGERKRREQHYWNSDTGSHDSRSGVAVRSTVMATAHLTNPCYSFTRVKL
jgi:hypothetical protein